MPKLLITGGTGLLGKALLQVMQEERKEKYADWSICVVSRNGAKGTEGDAARPGVKYVKMNLQRAGAVAGLFRSFKPNVVIHLAAKVGGLYDNEKNNISFFNTNVEINQNVLSECYRSKTVTKVISCLSTCIFPADAKLPLTVNQLHGGLPHSSNLGYAFSKRMLDVQNRLYSTEKKPFIGVIPCNMFGPGDNYDDQSSHVIGALIKSCDKAMRTRTDFVVKGTGTARRQFLFSMDAARLLLNVMESYDGNDVRSTSDKNPVIFAPPEEYSIKEIAEKIATLMGFKGGSVVYDSSFSDGQLQKTADGKVVEQMFGMKYVELDSALRMTIEDFRLRQQHSMINNIKGIKSPVKKNSTKKSK